MNDYITVINYYEDRHNQIGEIAILMHKTAKKLGMLIEYLMYIQDCIFSHLFVKISPHSD